MRLLAIILGLCLITIVPAACEGPESTVSRANGAMVKVDFEEWPDLADDMEADSLFAAIEQSRVFLRRFPPDRIFVYGLDQYTSSHLLRSLDHFERLYREKGDGSILKDELNKSYILYKSVGRDNEGEMLCTGYYEPLLYGSLARTDRFAWPVYRCPEDLIEADLGRFDPEVEGRIIRGRVEADRLIPYYSRREIDREGILSGRDLELVWVDDPIKLFFLHIQGSGRIRLTDGATLRVGYDCSNGRAYSSLGRYMVDKGLIPAAEISMQSMYDWLTAHPRQAADLLCINESYIFFRVLDSGVLGNINVPLTPNRTVAMDHRIFPKGALGWLASRKPLVREGQVAGWESFSRFVMVQDTGAAIKGPGRLDLFFGCSEEAELAAGRMKEPGRFYFLVMKETEKNGETDSDK